MPDEKPVADLTPDEVFLLEMNIKPDIEPKPDPPMDVITFRRAGLRGADQL